MIRKALNKIKIKYKTARFKKNANVGANTTFGEKANCFNENGFISIGDNCDIHAIISVKDNASIKIGDYTTIRYNSKIGAVQKIEIGSHVIISNSVTIYDNNNHPTDPQMRLEMCESGFYSDKWSWKHSAHKPVIIEDNVWVGEGATILKGVRIGKGAIVACHAVVTKDVEPYHLVAGNPAISVKKFEMGMSEQWR